METFKYGDTHAFYSKYYGLQTGSGLQVYRGRKVVAQRGEGIASVLASIAKKALPYAKTVGGRLLSEAGNFAGDLLSGENFAESAKRRLVSAGKGIVADFSKAKAKKRPVPTHPMAMKPSRRRPSTKRRKKSQRGRGADVFD